MQTRTNEPARLPLSLKSQLGEALPVHLEFSSTTTSIFGGEALGTLRDPGMYLENHKLKFSNKENQGLGCSSVGRTLALNARSPELPELHF